jgi:hypothetical protein
MLSVSNQEKGQRLARSFPGPCAVVDFGQPLAAITPVWSGQSPHQHMCSSCHLTPVSITGDLHCPGSSSGWGPRGQKVHLPTSSLTQLNHLPWLPGPGRQVKTRARQAHGQNWGCRPGAGPFIPSAPPWPPGSTGQWSDQAVPAITATQFSRLCRGSLCPWECVHRETVQRHQGLAPAHAASWDGWAGTYPGQGAKLIPSTVMPDSSLLWDACTQGDRRLPGACWGRVCTPTVSSPGWPLQAHLDSSQASGPC